MGIGHRHQGMMPLTMMLKAVDVRENWQRLYIRRWLQAPVQHPNGSIEHPVNFEAGWYGKFGQSLVKHVLFHFDQKLTWWAKRIYIALT